jgi:hypothetical protein
VRSLEVEIEGLERVVAEARRADSIARAARPRLIVEGDAQALAENQRTQQQCEAKIARAEANLKHLRDALQLAVQDERDAARARTYRELRESAASARQNLYALDDAITEFGRTLKRAIDGMESLESQMLRAAVTPDIYQLRAKFTPTVDMALHLATAGMFGQGHTMLTEHQLRESGMASLKTQGREYESMTMIKIRGALGVREK